MKKSIYSEGQYLENNPTWHAEDASWKASRILSIIQRNKLILKSICEVGCGSGEILSYLHSKIQNIELTGYEISPQAFEICREKTKEKLTFYLGNLFDEHKISYFDLILCIDVFEHVEDYIGFLKQLSSKSQYFIFHIPLDMSVSSVLRNTPIMEARNKVGHLHYFSKETALSTLENSGYKIIDKFYTSGSIDLTSTSMKTSLAKLPRFLLYKINPDLAARLLGGFSILVLAQKQQIMS